MRLVKLSLLALAGVLVRAQTPTLVPIAPSSLTFYSYSPVTAPTPPLGTQFLLTFPNQASGSQIVIPKCSTYANLAYNHYSYNAGTWTGPLTGPVVTGSPTMFYASTNASAGWSGLSFNASLTGVLGSNTSPSTQDIIQAVFFSTDNCYEYGPEVGFYRLLQNPGNTTEQSTVYFYYANNSNCAYAAPLSSCRDKVSGVSLVPNTVSVGLPLPPFNSQGGTNFIFSAYLTSPTNFHITIVDPSTGTVYTVQDVTVDASGFFGPIAATMFSSGLTGYLSATEQRTSTFGGITDSMTTPLRVTIYSLAQVAVLAIAPTPASGMSAAQGWCEKGGSVVVAPSSIGGSPISRSYQQSYPLCTVTVYNAGTTNLASIFSNSTGTVLNNPFQATNVGFWQWFAANGVYDVVISGGGLPAPYTLPSISLFDASSFSPTNLFAKNEIGVYGQGGSTFTAGFTSPPLANSVSWQLPSIDTAGCWESNGAGVLSIKGCSAAGPTTAIQSNNAGSFYGDANLLWNPTSQLMTVVGKAGTPSIISSTGFISSGGGFLSTVNNWQAFNSLTDGALLRGYALAPNTAGNAGGYINIGPLGYGNHPVPLPGLSAFGTHTALLWVSGFNDMAGDTSQALNSNLYINSTGGFAVCQDVSSACGPAQYNAMQVPNGGMYALSFTAANYIHSGSHAGPPPATLGDNFNTSNPGAMYYDTVMGGEQLWNGTAWVSIGSGGGGGSPGGPTTAVQINGGSGAFTGSSNLIYTSQQLQATAASSSSAAIYALTGFIQSDKGFASVACSVYNCFQAVDMSNNLIGGMAGVNFTATAYVQTGNYSTTLALGPTVTTNDHFHAGALSWSTAGSCEAVYTGTTWVCVSSSGAAGADTNVQYNSSGVFAGSPNFIWSNSGQLLTVTASSASTAGMAVATGFMQADQGFLATSGVATKYNVIYAPTGGMAGLSFTAHDYVQTGNYSASVPTGPPINSTDTAHQGAMSWSIGSGCEAVFNGTTWVCLASGSSSAGGSNTNVQYNNSGSFAGSANFIWNNGSQLLTVTAASSSVAGIVVATGYMQADNGFLATSGVATHFDSFHAPTGGMEALSFTAANYVQTGNGASPPSVTPNDTFHSGALFYNTTSACEQVYDSVSTNWTCIGSGGTTPPGGSTTNVQFNNAGSFGGSGNFTWNNGSQLLNVIGIASTAGINVQNGFIQSDGGFFVNSSNQYNSVHTTASGGMSGRSFTGSAYLQSGNSNGAPTTTSGDTFHAGAMYYDTGASCEMVHNGIGFVCLSTGAVSSLNGLTGALTIAGTTNEINVVSSGTTITLSTPQPIATISNVTFNAVTAGTTFTSNNTGSALTFQNSNGNFAVDGNGNVSGASVFTSTGSAGGFNVTNASLSSVLNTIQTVGGFRSQVSSGNNCAILYHDSVSADQGCVAADILWSLAQNGNGGLLRLSNGSGTGGLDGNGAQIYAWIPTSGGVGQLSTTGGITTTTGSFFTNGGGGTGLFANSTSGQNGQYVGTGIVLQNAFSNTFVVSSATGQITSSSLAGSATQCVQASSGGVLSGTAAPCGGSGVVSNTGNGTAGVSATYTASPLASAPTGFYEWSWNAYCINGSTFCSGTTSAANLSFGFSNGGGASSSFFSAFLPTSGSQMGSGVIPFYQVNNGSTQPTLALTGGNGNAGNVWHVYWTLLRYY